MSRAYLRLIRYWVQKTNSPRNGTRRTMSFATICPSRRFASSTSFPCNARRHFSIACCNASPSIGGGLPLALRGLGRQPDGRDRPGYVQADREKLRRAIVNIATNALEAMGDGGTLALRATSDGQGVRIAVSDTGPGIPEKIADRLFEPFVSHAKPNGTGLGLAITSAIVEAHGGCIEAANKPDGGAVFTIWLPEVCGQEQLHSTRP